MIFIIVLHFMNLYIFFIIWAIWGHFVEKVSLIVTKIVFTMKKNRLYFLCTKYNFFSFFFLSKACLILKLSDVRYCGILQICQLCWRVATCVLAKRSYVCACGQNTREKERTGCIYGKTLYLD